MAKRAKKAAKAAPKKVAPVKVSKKATGAKRGRKRGSRSKAGIPGLPNVKLSPDPSGMLQKLRDAGAAMGQLFAAAQSARTESEIAVAVGARVVDGVLFIAGRAIGTKGELKAMVNYVFADAEALS